VIPPLPEQRAIARILRAVQDATEARRHELALDRERKATLLQHLLTHGTRQTPTVETEIGVVPRDWRLVRLGALGSIQAGGTPSRNRAEFFGGPINWVKTLDLNDSVVTSTQESITEAGLHSIGGRVRPQGTVMVAMYGGAGTIGKSGILEAPAATNQAVCCMELNHQICVPKFVLHHLVRNRSTWMRRAIGTRKDPNISKGIVESERLALPSIEEQQEITAILDACDAKSVALQREIKLHEEFFSAMLEELMSGHLSALPLMEEASAA